MAAEAAIATGIRQRALRRAARAAYLWPEEVSEILGHGRSLTELHGVGPFIARLVEDWIAKPPNEKLAVPRIRRDFLTLTAARRILSRNPQFAGRLRGDLQMHTRWSDGSGTVAEMSTAAHAREYEYIAITDHAKGSKSPAELMNRPSRLRDAKSQQSTKRRPPAGSLSYDRLN